MGGSYRQQGNVGFLGILGLVLIVFLVVGECSKPDRTWEPPQPRTKHDVGVSALCEAGKRHRQRMRVTEASLVEAIEHCQQPGNSDSCKSDMTDEIWQQIREPVVKMYLPGNALVLRKTDEKCGSGLINMQARLSNLLTDLRKLVGR